MSIPKVRVSMKGGILKTTVGRARFHSQEFVLPNDGELLEMIEELRRWPVTWTFLFTAVNFEFMRTKKRQHVRVMEDGTLRIPDERHIQKSNDEYEEFNALSKFNEPCVLRGPYDESEEPLKVSFGCPGGMCGHTAVPLTDAVVARFKQFMGVYRGVGTLSTEHGANYVRISDLDHKSTGAKKKWAVQTSSDGEQAGDPDRMFDTFEAYEKYPSIFPSTDDWRPKFKVRDGMLCPGRPLGS